jgi:hypothetical protein
MQAAGDLGRLARVAAATACLVLAGTAALAEPAAPAASSGAVDPPEPPPFKDDKAPVEEPTGDSPEVERYQRCFQKMIDAGSADNEYMKRCLGIAPRPTRKGPNGELLYLNKRDVLNVALDRLDGLEKCYGKLLKQTKNLGIVPTGHVEPVLTIKPSGVVSEVRFEPTTLTDASLLGCFQEQLKAWRFPKVAEAGDVAAVFSFRLKPTPGGEPAASLAKGYPKLTGPGYAISSEEMLAVFRKGIGRLRSCYDALLKRKPGMTGKATVELVVDAGGRVSRVSLPEVTPADERFKACLRKELKAWQFPRPRSGESTKVAYPAFEFGPEK